MDDFHTNLTDGPYTVGHVERRAFALTLAILVALDLLLSALFVWHEASIEDQFVCLAGVCAIAVLSFREIAVDAQPH